MTVLRLLIYFLFEVTMRKKICFLKKNKKIEEIINYDIKMFDK